MMPMTVATQPGVSMMPNAVVHSPVLVNDFVACDVPNIQHRIHQQAPLGQPSRHVGMVPLDARRNKDHSNVNDCMGWSFNPVPDEGAEEFFDCSSLCCDDG